MLLAAIALPLCLEGEVLPIRSYTTADGLASDHIYCIVPDSRGFVWFCTPEGLSRFDGYRIVNFDTTDGLPDRSVDAFLETRAGTYFVGTDRGLTEFHSSAAGGSTVVKSTPTKPPAISARYWLAPCQETMSPRFAAGAASAR